MKSVHRIQVLGRELQVKSSAPEATVREIETFINKKVAEVSVNLPNSDQQLVTLLTLLNVSESYLTIKKDALAEKDVSRGAMERLLKKLDTALE